MTNVPDEPLEQSFLDNELVAILTLRYNDYCSNRFASSKNR